MSSNKPHHSVQFGLEDSEINAIIKLLWDDKVDIGERGKFSLYLEKRYNSLEKHCKNTGKDIHFNLLGAQDKAFWLLFYFFKHRNVNLPSKNQLTPPWPVHALTTKVQQNKASRLETLLYIEYIAYQVSLNHKVVIDLDFMYKVLKIVARKPELIQTDIDYLELAHKIRRSAVLSKIRNLKIQGDGKEQQFPDSFDTLDHLDKMVITNYKNRNGNLLPPSFFKQKDLSRMEITNCELFDFAYDFKMDRLFSLNLADNRFTYVPNAVFKLTNLQILSFANNQFKSLPQIFTQLDELRELDFSGNHFTEVPRLLFKMENLKKINFQNNRFVALPSDFIEPFAKKRIDLRDNWITTLPNEAEHWLRSTKFRHKDRPVSLLGNPLQDLPDFFCPLLIDEIRQVSNQDLSPRTLTCLFCWANFHPQKLLRRAAAIRLKKLISREYFEYIEEYWEYDAHPNKAKLFKFVFKFGILLDLDWPLLTYWLKLLHNKVVNHLDLSGIEVHKIPFEALKAWPKLRSLRLTDNALKTIGGDITQLENLRKLYLNRAGLKHKDGKVFNYALPLEIGHMERLTRLDLQENKIKSLPPGIGLMDNLKELNLSNNRFERFPVELCELDPLEKLDLSYNQIEQVPEDIIELEALHTLLLSHNYLKTLPSLPSLISLDLSNNLFDVFPLEILSLTSLEILKINQNRFTAIPEEIQQLNNLKELWINVSENTPQLKEWLPQCTVKVVVA